MPLHLPAISRRQFLGSTLAAGAGILTWQNTPAAEAAADPYRWILTADTHIAAERGRIHNGVKLAEKLKATGVEVVLAYPGKKDTTYGSPQKFLIEKLSAN